jgi:predicted N-acyltransferase
LNSANLQWHTDPFSVDERAWDALLAEQSHPTPFLRLAYLRALHRSNSACADTGWAPVFLTLQEDGQLVAACALYLKSHSWGEYVFDHAWADAYQRHGLSYYPKLLGAVPFTPVPGARLLGCSPQAKRALLAAIRQWALAQGISSAHLLFLSEEDAALARQVGWLMRSGVQFHWQQRSKQEGGAWNSFEEFLESLQREKRKKIRQERRRVQEAGVVFEWRQGRDIQPADWDYFYTCYCRTYQAHHNQPYLRRAFFEEMAQAMAEHWLMFIARREGRAVAASLLGLDPRRRVAFGRYWGCTEEIDCLHFEACYYQGLQWCIEQGYVRFEGGAQGEHKMARGLLPTATHSAHWLTHPAFAEAVGEFLEREGQAVQAWQESLKERNPFKGPST